MPGLKAEIGTDKSKSLRPVIIFLAILLLLFGSAIAGIIFGSVNLSVGTVLDIVKNKLMGINGMHNSPSSIYIVWNLRLPKAILAIAAGGGLAICGVAMQATTQNVLADPYILGVSSGASAMVSFAFFLGQAFSHVGTMIPVFAFAGAIVSMLLVYSIGKVGGSTSGTRIILAGSAVLIARSLTQCADILLLDEPTNHLDVHYQWSLMDTVKSLRKTVLAVFHELNLAAAFCDYIYVLKEQKVVAQGTPSDIFTPELLSEVFRVDAEVIYGTGKKPRILYNGAL